MRNFISLRGALIISWLFLSLSCNSQQKPVIAGEPQDNKEVRYKVTFVELGSVRCIPCQQMQPVMKSIEQKYGTQVKVVFHDVWTEEGAPYGKKYGIEAIPTQVFLDETGKEYFRHVGFFPEEELVKVLNQKGVK
jgi:thioredoxin 1